MKTHYSEYFCGNKISQYGLEQGYVDYSTFSKAFDAVLVNDITKLFYSSVNHEYIEPEQINGYIDNYDAIQELKEQIEELEDQEQIEELEEQIEELEREQDYQPEIFQYFIVSKPGADLIQEYTDDPLFYIDFLDCYVWGVTHYGTSWAYVLTDIKIEPEV